jgi:hypothetical protein
MKKKLLLRRGTSEIQGVWCLRKQTFLRCTARLNEQLFLVTFFSI